VEILNWRHSYYPRQADPSLTQKRLSRIYENIPECPLLCTGPVEFRYADLRRRIQQDGDEWHPLTGRWGSLFKPATISPVVVGTAPKSDIIRLRLNTLQLAAGMKGKVDRAVARKSEGGFGYGAIPL
jgi:hypothetical protein